MYIDNNTYKQIIDYTVIATLDIIFINEDNEILLWKRNNPPLKGEYYILWWRRYKNEKIEDTAKRKSLEELWVNIDINKLKFLWVYDDIFEDSIYQWIWTHCSPITYVYQLSSKELNDITSDSQHSSLAFFNINDTSLHEMVKIRIRDMKKLNLYLY